MIDRTLLRKSVVPPVSDMVDNVTSCMARIQRPKKSYANAPSAGKALRYW